MEEEEEEEGEAEGGTQKAGRRPEDGMHPVSIRCPVSRPESWLESQLQSSVS